MIEFDDLFHGQGRLIHVEFHVCMYTRMHKPLEFRLKCFGTV